MKKFYLLSAVALLTAVAATGCGKKPDADVDPTKAQLTVYTFEGGVGRTSSKSREWQSAITSRARSHLSDPLYLLYPLYPCSRSPGPY